MKRSIRILTLVCIVLPIGLVTPTAQASDEIRIAVASNFSNAIRALADRFEQRNGHHITLVFGATGRHYAQIRNGAPFTAFFAADEKRPKLLEEEGVAQPGSRFTYAIGKLVLWSPEAGTVDPAGAALKQNDFRHLALANPKLAPYGQAAREVLEKLGHWQALQGRIVRGENIGQTFQFVKSGNAELGFIAYSQIRHPEQPTPGSWWEIPQALYAPIEQQAVLLKKSQAGRDFLAFVRSEEGREIIRAYGYRTP